MLERLKSKKILILGFGKEGRDTLDFFRRIFPEKIFGIADRLNIKDLRSKKVKLHFGENYLSSIKDYDIVIKSPGIPFKDLPKSSTGKILTQTDIFFENFPGTVVGITGTKGKSTTTALIHKILKSAGIKAYLLGNIGNPVLSFLPKAKKSDVAVYELSSHQLHNLKKSPHIAVFLNVFPEHLDYYRNFDEYARSKANITIHQKKNDFLVFNPKDKIVSSFAKRSKAKKIPVSGSYYNLDKNAARAVGRIFKIPENIIEKAVSNFKYLPHRLELVGTFKGITFYNDALATIPEATMAAMDALGSRVETIMLGGFERNIDYKNLAKKVLKNKMKTVILFPTTGERIWRNIAQVSRGKMLPMHFFADNMKDAVKIAYQNTQKGKICLLSTAASSFSIFKDYKEKGDLFKKYVKIFGKN